jgi:ribA/ribD-fused uncharacterized protein
MAINQNIIYFWRQTEIPYGAFSNWSNHSYIDEEGNTILTSETGLMYAKWKEFDSTNLKLKNKILQSSDPAIIKKLGRQVKNFDQDIWDQKKFQIMINILRLKFSQNQELKNLLLSTNDSILVEASPYDKIWGIGLKESQAKKMEMEDWLGQNLLGKALMKVRENIRLEK